MASTTFTVTILKPDGTAFASANVSAYRIQSPDLQSVAATADPVTAATNASGVASLTLYRNTGFPVAYKLVLPNGSSGTFYVTQGESALNAGIIMTSSAPYRIDITNTLSQNLARYRNGIITQNATVATTSNTDYLFVAPYAGTLAAATATVTTTLTANDTNYVTFSITNVTNSNAAMLAATDPNTTKATGGSTWTTVVGRALTLNGTPANLIVAQGDVIRVRFAVTGTLGGALSNPSVLLQFTN